MRMKDSNTLFVSVG